jgi:hypothetical protein
MGGALATHQPKPEARTRKPFFSEEKKQKTFINFLSL